MLLVQNQGDKLQGLLTDVLDAVAFSVGGEGHVPSMNGGDHPVVAVFSCPLQDVM